MTRAISGATGSPAWLAVLRCKLTDQRLRHPKARSLQLPQRLFDGRNQSTALGDHNNARSAQGGNAKYIRTAPRGTIVQDDLDTLVGKGQ